MALRLTDDLRVKLRSPLGFLIKGGPSSTMDGLRKLIEINKPPLLITVGDAVTQSVLKANLNIKLAVVDLKILRKPIETSYTFLKVRRIYVKNPASHITYEAWESIRNVLEGEEPAMIIVEGEEDLLTIPAVLLAPKDSFIIYGQPELGIVIVKADDEAKASILSLLAKFEPTTL